MPVALPNTTTADAYPAGPGGAQLGGDRDYAYGSILVANNPVAIIVQHGKGRGQAVEFEYPYVTPTTIPLISGANDAIMGFKIKSALPGSPAQVSGWLVEPGIAGLQPGAAFQSAVAASGAVTPPGGGGGVMVTGRIAGGTGAIVAGTGFTCVRAGVGIYDITFTAGTFTVAPVVTGASTNGSSTFVATEFLVAASVRIELRQSTTGAVADADFVFAAFEMV